MSKSPPPHVDGPVGFSLRGDGIAFDLSEEAAEKFLKWAQGRPVTSVLMGFVLTAVFLPQFIRDTRAAARKADPHLRVVSPPHDEH